MVRGRRRHDLQQTADVLNMLANCHRLGMDRFDKKGRRSDGPHPKPWTSDEFLPADLRGGRPAKDKSQVIPGTIHCLKVFLSPEKRAALKKRDQGSKSNGD